jgi:transposase
MARPAGAIELHFIPPYCPHLNPIERLWAVMHKNVTRNKCYAMRTIRGCHARFLARQSPQELRKLPRFGHRQLPRHQPKGFSGSDVNGVYIGEKRIKPLGGEDEYD